MPEKTENILVIKHGALGDVVLAQTPFQAIRAHHPDAHITLLTTKPYKGFLAPMGLFDEIWVDEKPKLWNFLKLGRLRDRLNKGQFDRVYDLQTSSRSSSYLALFQSPKPEWSGIAGGCSHPHDNPDRGKLHTIERQREQLEQAGITKFPDPDFSSIMTDISHLNLPAKFALLVPGGSAHRPEKRWPAASYAKLASWLVDQGLTPVLLGGAAEADVLSVIETACSEAINLSGKTSLGDIASLGRDAVVAIGNDTGPLHLIAAVGCPVTVIFSYASDPARARPRGADVTVLREEDLENLSLEKVIETLKIPN
ncbi:glycosyltransferase family 9 protein [Sneathiella limimaris]|uniref:glycosyltransferase family 9 protein n=1 Tax=Sneathiella limimaris TaxID=1964213 RepID=UPI00146CA53B|nr:glycosyltransferase family 9 protein [Sneathiella limimaris]